MTSLLTLPAGETSIQKVVTCVRQLVQYAQKLTFAMIGGTANLTTQVTGVLPIANGGTGAATEPANIVFAGPSSGGSAAPSFRALVSADLPGGVGTVSNVATAGLATGGPITSTGTITVTAASKSDQQTGTSATTVVTPAHAGDHDGDAKAWVRFTNTAGTIAILASYNVASVVRNSVGNVTISFTVAFATANYACTALTTEGGTQQAAVAKTYAAGSVIIEGFNTNSSALNDLGMSVVCFGRQ